MEAPLLCTLLYLRSHYVVPYSLWTAYPMGKHVLILKGGTYISAILLAAWKGVSLFIPCTVLCGILLGVTVTGVKVILHYIFRSDNGQILHARIEDQHISSPRLHISRLQMHPNLHWYSISSRNSIWYKITLQHLYSIIQVMNERVGLQCD